MFSQNLNFLREKKGLSQDALAELLFVDRATVSKWEKGRRVPRDLATFIKIADIFEVTLDELIRGDEELIARYGDCAEKTVIDKLRTNRKIIAGLFFALSAWRAIMLFGEEWTLLKVLSMLLFIFASILAIIILLDSKEFPVEFDDYNITAEDIKVIDALKRSTMRREAAAYLRRSKGISRMLAKAIVDRPRD